MNYTHYDRQLIEQCLSRLDAAEAALNDARLSMHSLLLGGQRPFQQPHTPPVVPPQSTALPQNQQPSPGTQPTPPTGPRIAATAPQPQRAWWTDERAIVRLIATLGTIITIAGIFFLVALAIQHGLLGPLGRVILATIFAAVIAGVGMLLHRKHAHKAAVGAFLTTSLLSAMTTVFAIVVLLNWWPEFLGSAVIALLIVGFLTLAAKWNEQSLAVSLATGASIIALFYILGTAARLDVALFPFTFAGVALLITAHLRKWKGAAGPAGVITISCALVYSYGLLFSDLARPTTSGNALINIPTEIVCVVTALIFVAVSSADQEPTWNKFTGIFVPASLFIVGALDANGTPLFNGNDVILSTVYLFGSLCIIGIAIGTDNVGLKQFGSAMLAFSFLPLYFAVEPPGYDTWLSTPPVVCLFFVFAIVATIWMGTTKEFNSWPWMAWVLTALIIVIPLSVGILGGNVLWLSDIWVLNQAVIILISLVVAVKWRGGFESLPGITQSVIAMVGLYLSMVSIVALGAYIGYQAGDTTAGYLFGHAAVSVFWMVLASYVLLQAKFLSRQQSMLVGLVLAFSAIGKLVFFDLSELKGVSRVIAFLLSGVFLLLIAAVRSKRFSNAGGATAGTPSTATAPAPASAPANAPAAAPPASSESTPEVHPTAAGQAPMLEETPFPTSPSEARPWQQHFNQRPPQHPEQPQEYKDSGDKTE